MDVRSMSNTELKEQLLIHGVKPGPILPSTRSVYEKKLQKLLEVVPVPASENGATNEGQYSDSEDEGSHLKTGVQMKSDTSTVNGVHEYSQSSVFTVNVPVPRRSSLPNGISTRSPSPYKHVPASLAAEFNQNLATLGDDFSVTKMLKQMERRSSLNQLAGYKKGQDCKNINTVNQEKLTADKNTMTYRTPTNTPKAVEYVKQRSDQPEETARSEDLSEPMSQYSLGMSATRRKPIKGAAGRPIQFKYDDLATRAKMQEQAKSLTTDKEAKRLIPVSIQIAVFVVVAFIALVFLTIESNPENPFTPAETPLP